MSDVIVRLTVNKGTGKYDVRVIGHEGGSTCGDGLDESIINDLLNAEVPEFGQLAKEEDSGKTCEYFESKKAKQSPHKYNEDDEDGEEEEKTGKKLDLGYGV
jgi:hypothetical protein